MLLEGRTTVITGAAGGLGWAIARRFAEEGSRIVLSDVRLDAAEERVERLRGLGFEAVAVGCDVTQEEQVSALTASAVSAFGGIDVFINNAGLTRDNVLRKMSLDDFRFVMDVHLVGAWLGTRAAVAAMREGGAGGSIINMSSISGKVGNPGQTNYSAAKAGMVGLTKAAAKEVGRYGIRVNALQPGLIDTEMTATMDQAALAAGVAAVPLGRIGTPDEVADGALFLASDLSSYITGTVIEITGGRNI